MTESRSWPGPWVVPAARRLAADLLHGDRARWAHTRGVAARAAEAAVLVPVDQRPALVAAAWLHDVGYAPELQVTGFHPVDGARHLAAYGWAPVICGLVAHHSGARFVAAAHRLDAELAAYDEPISWTGPLADALTWADQTTSPTGEVVDHECRMAGMLRRHGPDSPQARAHAERGPALIEAVTATDRALLARRLSQALVPAPHAPAG